MAELNEKQKAFVREYLVDLCATKAAERAGYSKQTAYAQGSRLLKHDEIARQIESGMAKRANKTGVTAEKVLERLWQIAHADPGELSELRRVACRYCWDLDSAPGDDADDDEDEAEEEGHGDPNPDCKVCHGEGWERPFFKDTRHLSPEARALFAGVKRTKDGLEIKTKDQMRALELIGKHLGLFTEKHEHTGTIQVVTGVPASPEEGDE
jgi:phage terminase small subunit